MAKDTIEYSGIHGSVELTTEDGKTHLACWTSPGYAATVFDNNAETRRMLRTALARMEKEANGHEPS